MSNEFPAASTYEAVFEITDSDGTALDLTNASVTFALARRRASEVLLSVSDGDEEMTLEPNDSVGVVEVTIPAADVPEGTVFQELRVAVSGESTVVDQQSVTFTPVATEP